MEKKNKKRVKTAAVSGVAAAALLALLFGTGALGFGGGIGPDKPAGEKVNEEATLTERVEQSVESTETRSRTEETQTPSIEIRIQGREYNFRNVTYGNADHPTDELLTQLKEFPPDIRIVLIVEDNATKNAVDELERLLLDAGFTEIRR